MTTILLLLEEWFRILGPLEVEVLDGEMECPCCHTKASRRWLYLAVLIQDEEYFSY